ncbi:MAG: AGE family epimerase/isomerase [Lachnospiraceae bacterium]|nr:AGE family epimerase/isomerase [Lachnospiraceae bacterium]
MFQAAIRSSFYEFMPEEYDSIPNRVMKALDSDKAYDQFKPYGATPGHGIEWARLIPYCDPSVSVAVAVKNKNHTFS